MVDQSAQDITQMMSGQTSSVFKVAKKSRVGWVVLACMVVGVGLGIVAYQQSTKPQIVSLASPKPATSIVPLFVPSPTASVSATPVVPAINLVDEEEDFGDYEDDTDDWEPSSPGPSPSTSPLSSGQKLALASVKASPSASVRVVMPDTSEGVPTTGVFEITVGTVSVGLIFLVLGLAGLLAL